MKADAIFVGRLMKLSMTVRELEEIEGEHEVIECEFKVSTALKGAAAAGEKVMIITGTSGPSCGYPFRIGEEFLVYARVVGSRLETNVCMRTRQRIIIDESQDFSEGSTIKGDDAMETEVPHIREALKKE